MYPNVMLLLACTWPRIPRMQHPSYLLCFCSTSVAAPLIPAVV